jgi:hypothetical protein
VVLVLVLGAFLWFFEKQSPPEEPFADRRLFLARLREWEKMIAPERLVEADRLLAAALAQAERLDGPWQWNDLEARRAPVSDAENSAHSLEAINTWIPSGWPSFLYRSKPSVPDVPNSSIGAGSGWHHARASGVDPPLYMESLSAGRSSPTLLSSAAVAELRREMGRATAGVELARRLAHQPRGRPPFVWTEDVIKESRPPAFNVYPVSNLLAHDAKYRAQLGDLWGAAESCLAMLSIASAVGDTPTATAQSNRSFAANQVVSTLESVLGLGDVPACLLTELQLRLAAEDEFPSQLIALRGRRAAIDRLCVAMQNGEAPLTSLGMDLDRLTGRVQSPEEAHRVLTYIRAIAITRLNHAVEICKLPVERQDVKWEALVREMEEEPQIIRSVCSVQAPNAESLSQRARLRCTIAALAVERFRLQHGRWPEVLGELVSDLLPAIPINPLNGEPLQFLRAKDGAIVYAIGNGSRVQSPEFEIPASLFQTLNDPLRTLKVGFRLWLPNQRRQPGS